MDKCEYPDAIVEWEDAWLEGTEFVTLDGIRDSHAPWRTQTKGWVLQDDAKGISIANERVVVDGRERFRGRTFIPRGMVISVHPVVKSRKPRKKSAPEHPAL
jgi:hypothetical protein